MNNNVCPLTKEHCALEPSGHLSDKCEHCRAAWNTLSLLEEVGVKDENDEEVKHDAAVDWVHEMLGSLRRDRRIRVHPKKFVERCYEVVLEHMKVN